MNEIWMRVTTFLTVIIGALLALVWQSNRSEISSAVIELNSIDRRIAILETANVNRAEAISEQKDTLKTLSLQVGRIEKGLIRKRIIEP